MIYRFDSPFEQPRTTWEFRSNGPVAGGVEPFVTWQADFWEQPDFTLRHETEWECNGHATLRLTSDIPIQLAKVDVEFTYLDNEEEVS